MTIQLPVAPNINLTLTSAQIEKLNDAEHIITALLDDCGLLLGLNRRCREHLASLHSKVYIALAPFNNEHLARSATTEEAGRGDALEEWLLRR